MMHAGLEQAAARHGGRVAVRAGGDDWTFGALDGAANALARHLRRRGVGPGDRVALMCTNRPEFVVATHAVSKVGAAPVLVSPAWKALEVGHAVELTGPALALADGAGVAAMAEACGPDRVDDLDGEAVGVALAQGDRSPLEPGEAGDDAGDGALDRDAVLVFSSGTTGLPKAVRHTHRSIGHATDHWVRALGLGPDDRFQITTPPSHILGLLNLLAAARAGATVRLHARFDLDEVLARITAERTTLEMVVAPIALALANHPHLEDHDLTSLRYLMWGATPVTAEVAERVTARTGVRWLPAYGASEVPVIAVNPVDEPERWRLDSAGLPPEGVELRVVDLASGEPVPAGTTGEVQVRSASAMAGYLPDAANVEAFVDGWYRTGDVGWLEPEGWVHLTDRAKEMIKVKGFQVAPAEIEGVLLGHPAVRDCAVFGLPDPRAGEVPVAAVELDPEVSVQPDELRALVADSLAGYKQLRHVVVVESVPRLPSGKVLRRTLRDELSPALLAGGAEA